MSNSILSLPSEETTVLDPLIREFRECFQELLDDVEERLSGRNFIFSRYGKDIYPYIEDSGDSPAPGCIIPLTEGRLVSSVDSTCVLVGETSEGALYAARSAVGVSSKGAVRRYFRIGPILVYATAAGLKGLIGHVSRAELSLLLSDHAIAERMIRNVVERRIIESLLSSDGEPVVMADGSLKHPYGKLSGQGSFSRAGRGVLVGFSKSSALIFNESAVGALTRSRGPCYHLLDDGGTKTLLAKFSPDGLVFRLDVDGGSKPVEETLGTILGNDAFAAGYPESLKVAHHLSIFSKADYQALKAYVTKRFRVRSLPTFTLRSIALGGFKGGA